MRMGARRSPPQWVHGASRYLPCSIRVHWAEWMLDMSVLMALLDDAQWGSNAVTSARPPRVAASTCQRVTSSYTCCSHVESARAGVL